MNDDTLPAPADDDHDDRDDAVIAADDTGMIRAEQTLVEADMAESLPPRETR